MLYMGLVDGKLHNYEAFFLSKKGKMNEAFRTWAGPRWLRIGFRPVGFHMSLYNILMQEY